MKQQPITIRHNLKISRWSTLLWGAISILVAQFANKMGSLIEAGQYPGFTFLWYYPRDICRCFLFQKTKEHPVFMAALVIEGIIIVIYIMDIVSFLWLNIIGCFGVILFAFLIQIFLPKERAKWRFLVSL